MPASAPFPRLPERAVPRVFLLWYPKARRTWLRTGTVGNFAESLSPPDIACIDDEIADRGCEFTRLRAPVGA